MVTLRNAFNVLLVVLTFNLSGFGQEYGDRFHLENLGRKVNTAYHEAGPVVSADGTILYFFVSNHPENTYKKDNSQDIWYSELQSDGSWGQAIHMGKPLNQNHSNQVFTVLPDGNTLLIRGGKSKNSKGFSLVHRVSGNTWGSPEELKVDGLKQMNLGKFYGATMSSRGDYMVLYMSEKENSSISDLYLSKKTGENTWSQPVKIGGKINTSRDEFAPFLAPDDKTMYFASNQKLGEVVGGMDIYKTTRLDDTWLNWSDPVNLGRPLNTRAFDAYMSVDTHGNIFTTQSGKTVDGGNLDIFGLKERPVKMKLMGLVSDAKTNDGVVGKLNLKLNGNLVDTIMLETGDGTYNTKLDSEGSYTIDVMAEGYLPTSGKFRLKNVSNDTTVIKDFVLTPIKRNAILTGTVYDAETQEPINSKLVIVKGENGNKMFQKNLAEGYYESELKKQDWYYLTASAEGYLNANDSIEYYSEEQTVLNKDIYLQPIEIGSTVRLEKIYFDFDKTTLKSESFVELDKVVDFLNENGTVEIEIAGHTDSKGSDEYNLNLSQGRAEAVVNYLVGQGIDDFRLAAKGYGETVPLETNDTDAGRAFNRRVEFTVLAK